MSTVANPARDRQMPVDAVTRWRDQVEWWTDPRLAYAAGLADGVAIGRDQVDAELVAALTRALGGDDCADYRDSVTRHLRAVDQQARRQKADRGELAA